MGKKNITQNPSNSPVFWGVTNFAFLSGTGVFETDSVGLFLLGPAFK